MLDLRKFRLFELQLPGGETAFETREISIYGALALK
jgi:hypothetical protein